jgi:broad-specificity NMP kinase
MGIRNYLIEGVSGTGKTSVCKESRNFSKFIDLFDGVFVLEVDIDTLNRRLDERTDEWGEKQTERELIVRLHQTKEDIPQNAHVVDEIVRQSEANK